MNSNDSNFIDIEDKDEMIKETKICQKLFTFWQIKNCQIKKTDDFLITKREVKESLPLTKCLSYKIARKSHAHLP